MIDRHISGQPRLCRISGLRDDWPSHLGSTASLSHLGLRDDWPSHLGSIASRGSIEQQQHLGFQSSSSSINIISIISSSCRRRQSSKCSGSRSSSRRRRPRNIKRRHYPHIAWRVRRAERARAAASASSTAAVVASRVKRWLTVASRVNRVSG